MAEILSRRKARFQDLRRLTTSKLGAGFKALRLFYIQANRSLVDHNTSALLTLLLEHLTTLKSIQNQAMGLILAMPMKTRLANMRVETVLTSLHIRLQLSEPYSKNAIKP